MCTVGCIYSFVPRYSVELQIFWWVALARMEFFGIRVLVGAILVGHFGENGGFRESCVGAKRLVAWRSERDP